jgi:hypothetical protein
MEKRDDLSNLALQRKKIRSFLGYLMSVRHSQDVSKCSSRRGVLEAASHPRSPLCGPPEGHRQSYAYAFPVAAVGIGWCRAPPRDTRGYRKLVE